MRHLQLDLLKLKPETFASFASAQKFVPKLFHSEIPSFDKSRKLMPSNYTTFRPTTIRDAYGGLGPD
jgi:hypothetical protein